MADKKVTKKDIVSAMLKEEFVQANKEYVAYLTNELTLLTKKHEKKEDTVTPVIKASMADVLTVGKAYKVSEIASALDHEYSPQKITSVLRSMVADGTVSNKVEKGVSYYTIV